MALHYYEKVLWKEERQTATHFTSRERGLLLIFPHLKLLFTQLTPESTLTHRPMFVNGFSSPYPYLTTHFTARLHNLITKITKNEPWKVHKLDMAEMLGWKPLTISVERVFQRMSLTVCSAFLFFFADMSPFSKHVWQDLKSFPTTFLYAPFI